MKRRDFMRRAMPIPVMAFAMKGFAFQAFGRSRYLGPLIGIPPDSDHILVLIQLNGGNDGLNMVIPRDNYSALMNARANIAIQESKVLKLTDATGLHPAMTGLKQLYTYGKLAVVQSVGYPNPNFSHFRATDIWLTGSDSDVVLSSGWMGRYLDQEYPGFPVGYPNPDTPDPIAIQIGSIVSTGLQGPTNSMGMAITTPSNFYQLVSGGTDAAPNTPAGHELTFLRQVAQQTQAYASVITAVANKGKNHSSMYPTQGQNSLADQLKIVAQLINGGLKTKIYIVNLGGFDTHSAQVDSSSGTDVGNHAVLLGKLSDAIMAFQDDIGNMGLDDRVLGLTFSEFGRRIKSNASFGTDHGSAAPLFVFGLRVAAGVHGANPILPASATTNDNIPMQYDFRSVYASILRDWFGVSQTELEAVLINNFQNVPIIAPPNRSGGGQGPDGVGSASQPAAVALHQNYPNPFNPTTRISFSSNGGYVQVKIYDTLGREIRTLVDGTVSPGPHEVVFDADRLPAGTYFVRMQSGSFQQVKSMQLIK